MGRTLTTNVAVERPDGAVVWYGPAYGNEANVPEADAALIGDHCFEQPDATAPPEIDPADVPLEKRRKDDLAKLAADNNVDVDEKATKAQILEALQAAGVEG